MFKKHKILKLIRKVSFGSYFSIKEILVEAPNGVQAHYFVRDAEDYSIVIPFLDDKTVIMVRQHRVGPDVISLEFPMGIVTKHTPSEMAEIELQQETGYVASELTPIGSFYLTPSSSPQKAHVYIAKNLKKSGPQQLESTEYIQVEEVAFANLKNMIKNGEITDASTVAAFGLYQLNQNSV